MTSERILQLLAKRMGNDASEKEVAELNELLSHHPEMYHFIEILRAIEGEKKHYEPAIEEEEMVKEGWSLLEPFLPVETRRGKHTDNSPNRRLRFARRVRWAAVWSGILVLGLGLFYLWKRPKHLPEKKVSLNVKEILVPYGAPEKKILPDSSVVWLNAGSHISYADNFIQDNREVVVDGEAYFEVKDDAAHPFIVHAGNIVIHVLGTKFNIKAYDDENKIETTLINGKVQVQIAGNPDKKIVLAPNEKLTVINQKFNIEGRDLKKQKELSFQVKEVVPLQQEAPIPEIAWLQDKLAFQNERFGELAKGLERRYNVHIIFKDSLLMKERLNGVFENENIRKAMQLLQMTTPFHYKITGDTVYLKQ